MAKPFSSLDKVVVPCSSLGGFSLLFEDTTTESEVDLKEFVRLMASEDLRELFGPRYYGAVVYPLGSECESRRWSSVPIDPTNHSCPRVLVTRGWAEAELLLLTGQHRRFLMRNGDVVGGVDLAEAYDNCRHLMKFDECHECPLRGDGRCLDEHLPAIGKVLSIKKPSTSPQLTLFDTTPQVFLTEAMRLTSLDGIEYDDWIKLRPQNWVTQLAGYTLIPGVATEDNPLSPSTEGYRSYRKQRFPPALAVIREELSDRAQNGVKARKTRREQCPKCIFGSKYAACKKWAPNRCDHGAWTQEALVSYTLDLAEKRLEGSGFTLEDMWRVAHITGIPFKKQDSNSKRPRLWMVKNIHDGYKDSLSVQVRRGSRWAADEPQFFNTAEDLYAYLTPELQELWNKTPELNRDDLALWLQLAVTQFGKSYTFQFSSANSCGFMECTPTLASVTLYTHYARRVRTELWVNGEVRHHEFGDFEDIYTHFERLPLFSLWAEETRNNANPVSLHVQYP